MEKKSISRIINDSVRSGHTLGSMDQKSIVVFLHLKEFSAKAKVKVKAKDVHTELLQIFESDVITYLTVTKYIRNDIFCRMNQKPRIERKIKVSRFQTMQFWRHLK
jgi:hypothetical protein